ncbi:MAG: TetR family transcriptional regulator [Rhizobiales bacterium]|nr:TetR family transcriptional regulator [Hyphomicrobiales bacterium]
MTRRTEHVTVDLAERIRRSAREIASESGIVGLSAREIARRVGYSAGTLYNVFRNIDEIILHVEADMLAELLQELDIERDSRSGSLDVRGFVGVYSSYVRRNELAWSLFVDHAVPAGEPLPEWYKAVLQDVLEHLTQALAREIDVEQKSVRNSALLLWTALQGINSSNVAAKFSCLRQETLDEQTSELVETFVVGLRQRRAKS